MGTVQDAAFPKLDIEFDPARYCREELEFIKDNLGKNGVVAFGGAVPTSQDGAAIVPKTVASALDRFEDLEALTKQGLSNWCGYDAISSRIDIWLTRMEKFEADKARRGHGFHPEMHAWDALNRPHFQAPGSDSGGVNRYKMNMVSEGDAIGNEDWSADLQKQMDPNAVVNVTPAPTQLIEGDGYFDCPIPGCNHRLDYKVESRRSYNMQKQNMGKHMLDKTVEERELHRQSYALIFGS